MRKFLNQLWQDEHGFIVSSELIFVATLLVILMTLPGLALFYGGLVRSKNMLSVLMQVFMVSALIYVLWVLYGYTVAFTGGSPFFGSFDKVFLKGVTVDTIAATFSKGVVIPEFTFVGFQATFAAITCALIVGAFAVVAAIEATRMSPTTVPVGAGIALLVAWLGLQTEAITNASLAPAAATATDQLRQMVSRPSANARAMWAEIDRREAVAAGDRDAEQLWLRSVRALVLWEKGVSRSASPCSSTRWPTISGTACCSRAS